MRKLFTALIATTILSAGLAKAENTPMDVKLPFESAIINYQVGGSEQGTEVLYISDFGLRQAKYRKTSGRIMMIATSSDRVEITTPDKVINIDMEKKTGDEVSNPQKFMREEYAKLSEAEKATVQKNLKSFGTQMGAKVSHSAGDFMGFKCDIVSAMGITSWQISGTPVSLKTEGNLMGMQVQTVATSVDKKAPPANVFSIPSGVTVTYDKNKDDAGKQMAKMTLEWLKDPQAGERMDKAQKDAMKDAQMSGTGARQDGGASQEGSDPAAEAMKALRGLMGK